MKKEELISIIIPIYNVEKYLVECIESVMNQTYKNLEIILVDDGSTDKSLEICKKYEKKDNRIKVIHQENFGLSYARNVGIENANGRYLAFLDSDDFIEKNMYEELYNDLKYEEADIAGCDYYIYKNANKAKKSDDFSKEKEIMNIETALIKMNLLKGFGVSVWNKLFKKEIFNEIRFPVGEKNEDWLIIYKLLEKAQKIVYNPKAMLYYRQRKGSITKTNEINWNVLKASMNVLELTKNKYPKAHVSARFAYINANLEIYNKMLKNKYNKEQKKEIILNIKREKKGVLNMQGIRLYKKIQIVCISNIRILYDFIIKIKLKAGKENF